MTILPEKLETESEQEFALFVIYIQPELSPLPMRTLARVCEEAKLDEAKINEIAARNCWKSRAMSYDLMLMKSRQKKVSPTPAQVVANALIKLAGNTLAGTASSVKSNSETINKAVKLIDGYRKLK